MRLQTCSEETWKRTPDRAGRYQDNDTAPDDARAAPARDTQRLLDNLADGNVSAFWLLWDLHKRHLYHLCLWQMDGVREDAEDALSRSMLRALDKLPRMSGRIQNLSAWLSRLTVNLCVDMHREQKRDARRLEKIDDVLPAAGEVLQANADSPEKVFLNREAIGRVFGMINDLPPRLREPFALRFFQEMAYGDIAERLILTTDNVRKRIQQARDILRRRLIAACQGDRLAIVPRDIAQKEIDRALDRSIDRA